MTTETTVSAAIAAGQTPVIFRVWTGECAIDGDTHGNVIAVFPYEPFSRDSALCLSFEHLTQHGSAEPAGVISHSRPATADEALELLRELEAEPYDYRLHVLSQVPPESYASAIRARRAVQQRQAATAG